MYFEGRAFPERISVKQLWSDFSSWYSDTITLTGPHAVLHVKSEDVTQHDFDRIIMGRDTSRRNLGIAIRCTLRINGKSVSAYEFKPDWEERIHHARNPVSAPTPADRDGFGLLLGDTSYNLYRHELAEQPDFAHLRDNGFSENRGRSAQPYHRHAQQASYGDGAVGAYWEQPSAAEVLCAPSPSMRRHEPHLAPAGRRDPAGRDGGDGLWGVWEESAAYGGSGEDADELPHRQPGGIDPPDRAYADADGGYEPQKRPRLHAVDGPVGPSGGAWVRAEAGSREEDWMKLAGRGFAALS
jgi:hypothetical protein